MEQERSRRLIKVLFLSILIMFFTGCGESYDKGQELVENKLSNKLAVETTYEAEASLTEKIESTTVTMGDGKGMQTLFTLNSSVTFNVNVESTGVYDLSFRVRSDYRADRFDNKYKIFIDGSEISGFTGELSSIVQDSSGILGRDWYWGDYKGLGIALSEGVHSLKIVPLKAWSGIDYISIDGEALDDADEDSASDVVTIIVTDVPESNTIPVQNTYEAESDSTEKRESNTIVMGNAEGMQTLFTLNSSVTFNVNVASTGVYDLSFRVRSDYRADRFDNKYQIFIDGSEISGFTGELSSIVQDSSGILGSDWYWGDYKGLDIALSEGVHSLKIVPLKSWSGIDYLSISGEALDDADEDSYIEENVEENVVPVATSQSVTVDEDTRDNLITLLGTDADSDTLTYSIVTQAVHGTVSVNGNIANYTPTANYAGTDSFSFKVNDGKEDSAPAVVTVMVIDVPESNTIPVQNTYEAESVSTEKRDSNTIVMGNSEGMQTLFTLNSSVTFNVNVASAGVYDLIFRVRSDYREDRFNNKYQIFIDGSEISGFTGELSSIVQDSSGVLGGDWYWGNYKGLDITLSQGVHRLKIVPLRAWSGIDYLSIGGVASSNADEDTIDSENLNITIVGQLLEDAAKGLNNNVHYIVVGDSTRNFPYNLNNTILVDSYYKNQLNKIGVAFDHTAYSGMEAYRWKENISTYPNEQIKYSLEDTLNKIPISNHSSYIVEFSLGINDAYHREDSRSVLKETIRSSIEILHAHRQNLKILMVSPVTYVLASEQLVNTEVMEEIYKEVYTELVSEGATYLSFVSGRKATQDVFDCLNSDDSCTYYGDSIHPIEDGSLRLANYIFSEIGGVEVHTKMTVSSDDSPTHMSLDDMHKYLDIKLKER